MFKSYFLIAFKNLRKQKMFSLINILGLTVGITCCLMIFLFILNELSYDNFHVNGKSLYRVMRVSNFNGERAEIPYVSPPYSTALLNDYPDVVQQAVRIMPDNDLITYNNISFNEKNVYLADSNFFEVFSFPLLKGNPAFVLKEPGSIVLTATAAKKYFGNDNPIGKMLQINQQLQLKVTGIAKDIPVNSHLNFDMVVESPYAPVRPTLFHLSKDGGSVIIAKINPLANVHTALKTVETVFKKYNPLQPFDYSFVDEDYAKKFGDEQRTGKLAGFFAMLAIFISCLGLFGMASFVAEQRTKEIGVRKILGASVFNLWSLLSKEFVLLVTLSCTIAAPLAYYFLHTWLQIYAYRTEISGWIFVAAGTGALVITLITVSVHAIKAAVANPVKSLRTE